MLPRWPILYAGKTSAVWLIVGIAVLDLGVQGIHISNQSAIYALAPEARSRLTTAYMVTYFLGGAALSAISSAVYASDGWDGVCVVGAATGLAALALWAAAELRSRSPVRRVSPRRSDRPRSTAARTPAPTRRSRPARPRRRSGRRASGRRWR